jgi:hypothetical protein
MTTISSTATEVVVHVEPLFSDGERLPLAGFLAGYGGLTVRPTRWICGSRRAGASSTACTCSRLAAPTLSVSVATDMEAADEPGQRSAVGCAPCQGLPLRRRGRTARALGGRTRPPTPAVAAPKNWPNNDVP